MGQLVAPLAAQEEELSLALALGGPAPALVGPAAVVQEELSLAFADRCLGAAALPVVRLGAPALAPALGVRVRGARTQSRGGRA